MEEVEKKEEKEQEKERENKIDNERVENEIEELKNTLQRLQADFENYRKRREKEFLEIKKIVQIETIKEFLNIIDYFDNAMKYREDGKKLYEGISLIRKEFDSVLNKFGIKPIKTKGRFDPKVHEAVGVEENSEKKSGEIVEEVQKGYVLDDKIIRHAKVKVAR